MMRLSGAGGEADMEMASIGLLRRWRRKERRGKKEQKTMDGA
jgi:hypothetical protein